MDKPDALANQLNHLHEVDAAAAPAVTAPPAKAAGRPRAADLEARHLNLMETATRLFLEKGYGNVSLEMIARAAHVATRTIYVKFGGKAGLLHAVLMHNRARFFPDLSELERDQRPIREVITDFARRFWHLIMQPEARTMQRMVAAEAKTNPELVETFYAGGPCLTREMLRRFFERPDVRDQLYPGMPLDTLPSLLIACVIGDTARHFLFDMPAPAFDAEQEQALAQRLELFFRATLRHP